jgi:hypothetical protein
MMTDVISVSFRGLRAVARVPRARAGRPAREPATLFNFEGAALPSIGIFQNPADVCERYSPGSSPCVVGG